MYLKSFAISNAKCFSEAQLRFPGNDEDYAGWNVVLGINGTGKSTLLQAMALTMLGPVGGGRLLPDPAAWVRSGSVLASLRGELVTTANDQSTGAPRKSPYEAHIVVTGNTPVKLGDVDLTQPQVALGKEAKLKSLSAGPYSNRRGWFSAGYGPFRRLTGSGSEEDTSIAYGHARASRHLTLFRESAALTRCEKWLTSLHSQANDPALDTSSKLDATRQLDIARRLIDGLLPEGVRIHNVTSVSVTFATQFGVEMSLGQLSDGYRSFLALSIDLLRHILDAHEHGDLVHQDGRPSLDTEGVVLIDEADAHLHPTWQREIGFRMCEVFPKLQFIVSTHSPFVAQAARNEGIFIVRAQADGTVIVERSDFSVRGWRADQILLSPLFGLDSTRDVETEQLLARHTELKGRRLSPAEGEELAALERELSRRLTAPGDSLEERERQAKMDAYIDDRLGRLEREKRT